MKHLKYDVRVEAPEAGERGQLIIIDQSPDPTGTNGCWVFCAYGPRKVMFHQLISFGISALGLTGDKMVADLVTTLNEQTREIESLKTMLQEARDGMSKASGQGS